ncbi:MAG: alpha/beta hydrolase [Saprospiraceae bacterium]|nr:alpha/beta hydrolase [Saprospiraceae bacterium]
MTRHLLFLFFSTLLAGCMSNPPGQIKINSSTAVEINDKALKRTEEGIYVFNEQFSFPTILTLKTQDQEWEIFWDSNKNLDIKILEDSLAFQGSLIAENQHLLSEKKLNDDVSAYLNQNWYSLHIKNEVDYTGVLDSLKSAYFNRMDSSTTVSTEFKKINEASINFAFGRMLLRYPRFHRNFTGNSVALSPNATQSAQENIDDPTYCYLKSYQRYTKTWLDSEIRKAFSENQDTSVYRGLIKTQTALELIPNLFKNQKVIDYWSFEYIKTHIEQCTWINGEELLSTLETNCKTLKIKQDIEAYKNDILRERADLETIIYKIEKGFQLEVYIFKPQNFDPLKKYAALAAFHGGGWTIGDASFTIESAQHAADHGLIGFSVEYRLSNQDDITPREAMQDTRDFIKWLRQNADSLSVNPDQIIAKGFSAGGHLVSSTTVLQENQESIPNAMILISPALDTRDDYFKSLLKRGKNSSALSPLENLKEGLNMPKILLLQGRTDNLTPTKFAEEFDKRMNELGYDCELVIYEGCGHLFTPSHLDDTGWPQSDPAIVKKAFEKQVEFYQELGFTQK